MTKLAVLVVTLAITVALALTMGRNLKSKILKHQHSSTIVLDQIQ